MKNKEKTEVIARIVVGYDLNDDNTKTANELQLSCSFGEALRKENYELCSKIKKEVNSRIKDNTINHQIVQLHIGYNSNIGCFNKGESLGSIVFDKYNSNGIEFKTEVDVKFIQK